MIEIAHKVNLGLLIDLTLNILFKKLQNRSIGSVSALHLTLRRLPGRLFGITTSALYDKKLCWLKGFIELMDEAGGS
jgi:hypothetical protein